MKCEWCHARDAVDPHHCLINHDKNNHELDDPRNIGMVCRECHSQWIGTGGRLVKESWWKIQCTKFGEAEMQEWYSALNLIIKERFW